MKRSDVETAAAEVSGETSIGRQLEAIAGDPMERVVIHGEAAEQLALRLACRVWEVDNEMERGDITAQAETFRLWLLQADPCDPETPPETDTEGDSE